MGDSKSLIVETSNGPVVVKKLALGDYAALLKTLKNLPKRIGEITKKENEELTSDYLVSIFPEIVSESLPEVAGMLSSATDKDTKFILELDLADVLDIFDSILELNDFDRVVGSIKKIQARFSKPAQVPNQ